METNKISLHACRIFRLFQNGDWLTSADIAFQANVSGRTARLYAKRFTDAGLVDFVAAWPKCLYRFSDKAARRNKTYLERIERACDAFGI